MNRIEFTALLGLSLASGAGGASGFALIEQNASGLGNAHAGQAAVAEDAGTVYYNPAGMTGVEGRQVVLAAHYFRSSSTLDMANNGGDAGNPAVVPGFFHVMDLAPEWKGGVGVSAPFGLATEYDAPWAGQTQAISSHLKTINVNPSLAWRVNDEWSVGAGVNWQSAQAKLTQSATAPAVTEVAMRGEDSSWGWNLGALWQMTPDTRVGLAYRSAIAHRLTGKTGTGTPIRADLRLPDSASLSLLHRLNPRWDLLADVSRTGWSSFDKLDVRRQADGVSVSLVDESWQDTWRYALGLTWRPVREWTWRMGLALDESPVPDAAHRTPRIPDADRTWLALGGQYRFGPRTWVDFGYAHLFVRDAPIDHTENGVTLTGSYDNRADVLSAQYTRAF